MFRIFLEYCNRDIDKILNERLKTLEVKLLEDKYNISYIQPFNNFPRTYHVETVALLSKIDVDKHISVEIELDELDLTSAENTRN